MFSASSEAACNAPSTSYRTTEHQHRASADSMYGNNDSFPGDSSQKSPQPIDDSLSGFNAEHSRSLPLTFVSPNVYSVKSNSHQQITAAPGLTAYEEIRRRRSSPGQDELRPHDLILRDSNRSNENQAPRREGKYSTSVSKELPPLPPPHSYVLPQQVSRRRAPPSPPRMGNAPLQAMKKIGKKKTEETQSSDDEGLPSPGIQNKASSKAPALKLQFTGSESLSSPQQPQPFEILRPASEARSYQDSERTIKPTGQGASVASTETLKLLDTPSRQSKSTSLQEEAGDNDPLTLDRHTFPKRSHSREKSTTTLDFLTTMMQARGIGGTTTVTPQPATQIQTSTLPVTLASLTSPAPVPATPLTIPTISYKCPPPPTGFPIPPLTIVHFSCYQSHANMTPSKNIHAPVPCVVCGVDDTETRYKCSWCCLRICRKCMAVLEEDEKRDLKGLVLKRGHPGELKE